MKVGSGRGVGLRRGGAAAAAAPPTRCSRWRWPRRGPTPASRSAAHTPSLAAAYPSLVYATADPGGLRRPRRGVLRPAPRGVPAPGARAGRPGGGRWWTWPPTSGCATPSLVPAVVRRGARRARPPGARSSTACPSSSATGWPGPGWWRRRLLPDGGRPGPGAPASGPGRSAAEGIVVDAASGVSGAGRAAERPAALRHGRRGLHRLRPARPPPHPRDRAGPRGQGAVHPAPGPDDPGHPGHLLRPAGGRRSRTGRRPRDASATPTPTNRSWWSPRTRRPPRPPPAPTAPT